MNHDAMILVASAAIDPQHDGGTEDAVADEIDKTPQKPDEEMPQGRRIPNRTWTNRQGQQVAAPGVHKAGEDFLWIKTKGKWITYPLVNLSEADRAVIEKEGP